MDTSDWPCRIKSARRKRRLVKTDRDKQLIQLYKRRDALWDQRAKLSWIPLAEPYQSGWKRFFVLLEDIRRSPKAAFYEALLEKVNTVEYNNDKSFKRKKRRKGRYIYAAKKQQLQELDEYLWNSDKLKLTERERECFTRVETFSVKTRLTDVKYVITDPWRFVLKIAPYMVTHIKPINVEIQTELAAIANHIENYQLEPRMYLLTRGKGYNRDDWFEQPAKYINNFKNLPRNAPKEAYLDINA